MRTRKIVLHALVVLIITCIGILMVVNRYSVSYFKAVPLADTHPNILKPIIVSIDPQSKEYIVKKATDDARIKFLATSNIYFLTPHAVAVFDQTAMTATTTRFMIVTYRGGFNQQIVDRIAEQNVSLSADGNYILIDGNRILEKNAVEKRVFCVREVVAQYSQKCEYLDELLQKKLPKHAGKALIQKAVWDNDFDHAVLLTASESTGAVSYWKYDPWNEGVLESVNEKYAQKVLEKNEHFRNPETAQHHTIHREPFGFISIQQKADEGVKPELILPVRAESWVWLTGDLVAFKSGSQWTLVNLSRKVYAGIGDLNEVYTAVTHRLVPSLHP